MCRLDIVVLGDSWECGAVLRQVLLKICTCVYGAKCAGTAKIYLENLTHVFGFKNNSELNTLPRHIHQCVLVAY